MENLMRKLNEAKAYIESRTKGMKIYAGLVLGSGLGDMADETRELLAGVLAVASLPLPKDVLDFTKCGRTDNSDETLLPPALHPFWWKPENFISTNQRGGGR